MYKNSILLFGIVIPIVLSALVLGASAFVRGKVISSYENKVTHYAGYKQNKIGAFQVEAELSKEREHLERWQKLLQQETFSLVTTNLRQIAKDLPPKEFQQTAFERLPNAGGIGSVSAQNSSGLKFNFRGTFRTVQHVFLELETMMPNLQLSELRIDPNNSPDSSLLDFQVVYSAWEN
ncbi:MAG: hypothetical protein ACSHX7_04825 [Luteolibacter sp.]